MTATVFLQAADMFAAAVEQVRDDQWDQPGLGEWDVRALVGHTLRAVTTVSSYLAQPAPDSVACGSAGEYFVRVRTLPAADDRAVADRGHQAGRDLGPDPLATVRAGIARASERLAQLDGADPVLPTVAGGMRLSDYLPTRTFELLAHSNDLAAATGAVLVVPLEVGESALQTAVAAMARLGDGNALLLHLLGRPGGEHRPMFG